MVGGQVIDLQHENQRAPIEVLLEMDRKKTGALIQAAAQMGCAVAGGGSKAKRGGGRICRLCRLGVSDQR